MSRCQKDGNAERKVDGGDLWESDAKVGKGVRNLHQRDLCFLFLSAGL